LKKLFLISAYYLFFSGISLSWSTAGKNVPVHTPYLPVSLNKKSSAVVEAEAECLYNQLNLGEKGLAKKAFTYAYRGYQYLLTKGRIKESAYLTICDLSQSSNNKRFYLVDLANDTVLLNTYVAHGRNSGGEYATRFSNKPSSLQSCLGFFVTQDTYYGEHGLSLRLVGVEAGYNDKAIRRRIVVHGADYIEENWLKSSTFMGRSYGCPAVPEKECDQIINTIKNGSCLFIYYPSKTYLKGSKILND